MNYKKLLNLVATEHNTTPEEVDREMRNAINAAGYNMEPELFIALVTAKVKGQMNEADE